MRKDQLLDYFDHFMLKKNIDTGVRGFLKWTSELGGLTGIWFGASIISFIELLELLFDIIVILFSKNSTQVQALRSETDDASDDVSEKEAQNES